MNKNLQQFGVLHTNYSIDEQAVPYTGKNSSKQTIRTKIIRFVYKNYDLCSDKGHPYFADRYCGKKYGGSKESKNLSTRSVLDSVTKNEDWSDKEVSFSITGYCLFPWSVFWKNVGFGTIATGTIRADRLGKDLKINNKDLKHQERGFI